jgi:hypothetical protein
MANTILTPDEITREALMILHQKATFIGSINRQYDDSFAKSGAKIGDSLRVRLPNAYTTGDGASITPQATTERSLTLQITNQKHVALEFTTVDLTLKLDDFSKRILEPAVTVLAAKIEADALSMYKDVYQQVDDDGAAFDFDTFLAGREKLNNSLAPMSERSAILTSAHARKFLDGFKANFNPQVDVAKQNREGAIGRVSGFDVYEHTMLGDHTTGTAAEGDTSYDTNQVAAQDNTESLVVDTGTATFKRGDIIEIEGVNRVHPETKEDTGALQQFVVTSDVAASATAIPISPKLIASGPYQNVTNGAANNKIIYKRGAGNAELLNRSMVYHKDAFTFVTADLKKPDGLDFAARRNFDGISMRILQDYDILTDTFIGRLDVLYGFKAIRPELAVRLHADG